LRRIDKRRNSACDVDCPQRVHFRARHPSQLVLRCSKPFWHYPMNCVAPLWLHRCKLAANELAFIQLVS